MKPTIEIQKDYSNNEIITKARSALRELGLQEEEKALSMGAYSFTAQGELINYLTNFVQILYKEGG